ncbi:MAG: MBOAT family O-acyltransferase [Oscillospiraceae bacterium]
MLFTSLKFAGFVALALLAYYCVPKRFQSGILLVASLVFYASFGKRYLVAVLASAVSVYVAANIIERIHSAEKAKLLSIGKFAEKQDKQKIKKHYKALRRMVLYLCLLFNLGGLLLLKFYPLAQSAAGGLLPKINIILPVGISFYTLQITGYLIDVYNKKVNAEKSAFKTILFTTFFPQIIEGPISRFDALAPALASEHSFDYDSFILGLYRILWGVFKKLVLADRLSIFVIALFDSYTKYTGVILAIGAVCYTVQLYADFSGGIDIALGVSKLFGIELSENFKRPFFSKSISEFWRRWHITLGTWLRDYIFYPLTLSKAMAKFGEFLSLHVNKAIGKWVPAYISLLVLWICNGIWHGAGGQYIAFGLYHGILIMIGMALEPVTDKWHIALHIDKNKKPWQIFSIIRTSALVVIGELIFRCNSFAMAVDMIKRMFSSTGISAIEDGALLKLGLSAAEWIVALVAMLIVFMASVYGRDKTVRERIYAAAAPKRFAILLAGILAVAIFGIYGGGYDPTPFIYFKF